MNFLAAPVLRPSSSSASSSSAATAGDDGFAVSSTSVLSHSTSSSLKRPLSPMFEDLCTIDSSSRGPSFVEHSRRGHGPFLDHTSAVADLVVQPSMKRLRLTSGGADDDVCSSTTTSTTRWNHETHTNNRFQGHQQQQNHQHQQTEQHQFNQFQQRQRWNDEENSFRHYHKQHTTPTMAGPQSLPVSSPYSQVNNLLGSLHHERIHRVQQQQHQHPLMEPPPPCPSSPSSFFMQQQQIQQRQIQHPELSPSSLLQQQQQHQQGYNSSNMHASSLLGYGNAPYTGGEGATAATTTISSTGDRKDSVSSLSTFASTTSGPRSSRIMRPKKLQTNSRLF